MDHRRLQRIADHVILILAFLFGTIFFGGGLYHLFVRKQEWIVEILKLHFGAIVMPPLMATMALMVILLLKMSQGDIKFKFFQFEVEGAAGPVLMWVISYLAIAFSVYLLW